MFPIAVSLCTGRRSNEEYCICQPRLGLWLNTTTHKMILLPYLLFFFYVHNVISLLIIVFFRLPCPPLAKRGSLTHSQALALSKRARDVTAPPVALNRYAIRLAGHQSPRQVSYAGWDRLAESGASEVSPGCAGWNRLDLTCYYLAMTYYYLNYSLLLSC